MVLVFFTQGYAAGTEIQLPTANFPKLADMRKWIQFKRDAHVNGGWIATVDTVDSVEVVKTVIDGGVIVKTRRFFVR